MCGQNRDYKFLKFVASPTGANMIVKHRDSGSMNVEGKSCTFQVISDFIFSVIKANGNQCRSRGQGTCHVMLFGSLSFAALQA